MDLTKLPPDTLLAITGHPRSEAALLLLTAELAPLPGELAYPVAQAGTAYLISTLGYLSRRQGLLAPYGWSEQKAMLRGRVEGALQAPSPGRFLASLAEKLKVPVDVIPQADRLWWRAFSAIHFPALDRADGTTAYPDWRRVSQRENVLDLLTAAELLSSWMPQLSPSTPAPPELPGIPLES